LTSEGQEESLCYLFEAEDRVCLGTFLALNDVKFDVITFFEALISVELDCGVVDEDIGAVFASDESITFCVVKPFDLAFISSHVPCPFLLPMAPETGNSTSEKGDASWGKMVFLKCKEFHLLLAFDGNGRT
jgi:hypothetical protein